MVVNAELAFHILRYGVQKLAEDDLKTLVSLGFTIEEIRTIETLTLNELHHLSDLSGHFLDVSINHQRLAKALDHLRREAQGEALQDELLRLRAPTAMMRALFGMTPLQYAIRRKLLGLAGIGVGRPALPDEATERLIWQTWQQHAQLAEGKRYLATAQATRLPLSVVWTVVQAGDTETLTHCADDPPPVPGTSDAEGGDAEALAVLRRG